MHRHSLPVLILVSLTLSLPALAQSAAPAASAPAQIDPEIGRLLDELEAEGKRIQTIRADLTYVKIDEIADDRQEFTGTIKFRQQQPNPRFLIEFNKFKQEGTTTNRKEWHAFDGQNYLTARERNGPNGTTEADKREIVKPGEKVEVFRIGQGPFPLPFGQKKEDILKHFRVAKGKLPAAEKDQTLIHLECTPLPGTEMAKKYDRVSFYVDDKLKLPVYVETKLKEEDDKRVMARFNNVVKNVQLTDKDLSLPADIKIRPEPAQAAGR